MKIMLDTNILISIAIFNSDILKKMLISICDKHTLMLSTQIIKELKKVVKRKFPNKIKFLIFLSLIKNSRYLNYIFYIIYLFLNYL